MTGCLKFLLPCLLCIEGMNLLKQEITHPPVKLVLFHSLSVCFVTEMSEVTSVFCEHSMLSMCVMWALCVIIYVHYVNTLCSLCVLCEHSMSLSLEHLLWGLSTPCCLFLFNFYYGVWREAVGHTGQGATVHQCDDVGTMTIVPGAWGQRWEWDSMEFRGECKSSDFKIKGKGSIRSCKSFLSCSGDFSLSNEGAIV